MYTLIALIGALSLAAIPIVIGWRRTAGEAGMAKALGLAAPQKRFDPEKIARQTGTGLTFNQMAFGALAWAAGGFLGGLAVSLLVAVLFAIAGGLFYVGGLSGRKQEFRLRQARDILRGLSIVQTLLEQGRTLPDALEESAQSIGPDGRMVLGDLVYRLRSAAADKAGAAVREWTLAWDNPGVDMLGTALLASLEGRVEIGPLVGSLRKTLNDVIEVLARARAEAKGIEWQARFLALFPPGVLVVTAIVAPEMGRMWADNPIYIVPTLFGSGVSYLLSARMVRNGLSIEASVGLGGAQHGEVRLDRMGRVL
jgi:Flp pilus assembly protein TadB